MIQFLLTTSLVLHLLTFLWIITLLQKVNNQQAGSINDDKLKREIEDLLVAYTTEMKEENEQLLKQIKQYQQKSSPFKSQDEIIIDQPKVVLEPTTMKSKEEQKEQITSQPYEKTKKYEGYQPPTIEEEKPDLYEQSNAAKVLLLSKQGLTPEEIAKKLNLGKGEVELMIKFYQ